MRLLTVTPPRTARARAARRHRLIVLGLLAAGSLAVGVVVGAGHKSSSEKLASRFVADWKRGDYRGMYGLLTDSSKARYTLPVFVSTYTRARDTATMQSVSAGEPQDLGSGIVRVPMIVNTRLFGPVKAELRLQIGRAHV